VTKPTSIPTKRCEGACGRTLPLTSFAGRQRSCVDCAAQVRRERAAEQADAKPPAAASKRPTEYSPEIGQAIAERIAAGGTIKAVCAEAGMPSRETLARWRIEHPELAAMLAQAREARADIRADRVDEYIAAVRRGDLDANAARVMIDAELRLARVEHPARYGEKVHADLTSGGAPLQAGTSLDLAKALLAVLPRLALPPPEPLEVEAVPVEAGEGDGTRALH
jgi:transposase-like protein